MAATDKDDPESPKSGRSQGSSWSSAKKAMERQSTRALAWGASIREYNQKKYERSMSEGGSKKSKTRLGAAVSYVLRKCFCCRSVEGELPPAVTIATDVEDLKQSVRQKMSKTTYSVKDYYKSEGICQRIAKSNYFENFTLFIIAINSLWIWIDTDNNSASIITEAKLEFQIAENFFCAFFTFEWLVRMLAFRKKIYGFMDAWFVFDTLLVALMIMETWITPIVLGVLSISSEGVGDATVLRLVRLLRLARMTRVAKLLRAFPEVLIMIKGISAAARSVFFTIFLLVLVLYIFGIAFKQICEGLPVGKSHFSTVPESMLVLLIHGVFMDDMAELVALIRADSSFAFSIFILFVLIASITLMNMLIGVLCEVVSMVGQSEREELLVDLVKRELLDIIIEADEDGDGLMSHAEFLKILESPEGLRALETVGVDPVGLIDYADQIFAKENGEEGQEDTVLFSHFMNEILQLRGTNTCTVKDLINMRKVVEKSNKDVKEGLLKMTTQLATLEGRLEDLKTGCTPNGASATAAPRESSSGSSVDDLAKPDPCMLSLSKTATKAPERFPRDLSPVPLQAHMPPVPVASKKSMGNIKASNPTTYSSLTDAWATTTKTYFPDMEGSLSQKLLEMQDILNQLIAGPHSAGTTQLPQNGDAAGGKLRSSDVASQIPVPLPVRRGVERSEDRGARERIEGRKREDSRTRFAFRVYGRPVNAEDVPTGRVLGRYLARRPSRHE